MLTKRASWLGCAGFIGVAMSVAAGQAAAQGVVNPGALPQFIPINSANTWEIGNAANPIPVALDPFGNQPWRKQLGDQNTKPFGSTSIPVILPGTTYTLHEYLLVDPAGPAWTDWHEDILDPSWTWTSGSLQVIFGTPTAPPVPVGLGTSNISFFFTPVAPGSIIEITKQLTWAGGLTVYNGFIPVNEYPTGTPEPASLMLIAGAGAFFLKRPRRGLANVA